MYKSEEDPSIFETRCEPQSVSPKTPGLTEAEYFKKVLEHAAELQEKKRRLTELTKLDEEGLRRHGYIDNSHWTSVFTEKADALLAIDDVMGT